MRGFIAAMAVLVLATGCSWGPPVRPVPDSGEPDEVEGEVSREVREVPGAMYIHRARVAYLKYREMAYKQQERENALGKPEEAYIPLEYMERKKEEYLAEAERNLRKVLEINPDSAMSHQLMGLIHLDRGDYGEAAQEFREVLRIDPLAANAWVNLAHVHWKDGKAGKAKEAIAEALKINPSNQPALQLRDMIEEEERKAAARESAGEVPPFRPRLDR